MNRPISRRKALIELSTAAIALLVFRRTASAQGQEMTPIVVYKDANCGCCNAWVAHMEANGFNTMVTDMPDMAAVKKEQQVAENLQSCHTSVVGGYVIEGHVPAADVRRLLKQKPKVHGLTIPGMPASAPGMDLKPFKPYDVLTFDTTGKTTVFAKHTKA